ncbi:MAG: rhamnogalacturonan acetylesterase [Acidobacteriota bacterium]|nr:rhamnogalacturonan acetylesterase [Acidobacteriota bacterium]
MLRRISLLAPLVIASAAEPQLRFDFGAGKAQPGYTHAAPEDLYSPDRGYGFEAPPRDGNTAFFFSVRVPEEGNYRVTVKLGSPAKAAVTTVKAELRRLMLEQVHTQAGRFESHTFIVNVRTPEIPAVGRVKLKPRETTSETWAWDDKITLEFSGIDPAVQRVEVEKARGLPTIYIAGDSTSTDQAEEPFNSWGQMIPRFFQPTVAIANNGESGESLRSFLSANRLAKILSVIRPGDYLFIQMGHNDQKEKGEGVGAFTTYKTDLKRFVAATHEHGATPVLITSMHRLTFDPNGRIVNSLGDFPEAVRQTAAEEHVALIDLNAMSKPLYEALGPVDAHKAFAGKDTTHHSDYGSYELAKCVVQGIHTSHLPLAGYLVKGLPEFNPAHPDPFASFTIPPDPILPAKPAPHPTLFLVGDSTVRNGKGEGDGGQWGWGEPLAHYFDSAKIDVQNRAAGGTSSRTYMTSGRWAKVLSELKPGDFVLMQFGHNDGGALDDPSRARGTIKGAGSETKEIDNPITGQHEVVHTYGWYLKRYIEETRAKGAIPMVCSPVPRKIWRDGAIAATPGSYATWASDVASSEHVSFLDLAGIIAHHYNALGPEKVNALFADEHTHTTRAGAELNAACVVEALKALPSAALGRFLAN